MQIIDAQVHIWGSGTPSGHHRQTSIYTAEELIKEMDEAGVNGAVLHPPSWDQRLQRNGGGGGDGNIRTGSASWAGSRSTSRRSASASRPGSSAPACSACAGR